ncbi:MAG TPA: protein-L-isoaspartate(D-aspartate) O-methyltransferase, partial [Labilithrix sp.]
MDRERQRMIEEQLVRRGITDARVLDAFRALPRETFVTDALTELAYQDSPLPIGEGQTISQPYVVALTFQALGLRGDEKVLEIGTGSGYAAALLGLLASEVWTVERIASLAETARARLASVGLANVHVAHADGSLGLPAHAPYDAIAVAASGPRVPQALRDQLAIGGRLVMPVGVEDGQHLVRVTRLGEDEWSEERLIDVTFVPLIGAAAWPERGESRARVRRHDDAECAAIARRNAEPFDGVDLPLRRMLRRIGDARVVVLGGSLDGSEELWRARTRLTWELFAREGFSMLAIEGDWADAARLDDHVHGRLRRGVPMSAFARVPELRNTEVARLLDALGRLPEKPTIQGLDMLGTTAAVAVALERLEEIDTERAAEARRRWSTLSPWRRGVADLLDGEPDDGVENAIVATLASMLDEHEGASRAEGRLVREAIHHAHESADGYYRRLLRGRLDAWTMREEHMFEMLDATLADHGPRARIVVWANDAHVADAEATETGVRGHETLGGLCRAKYGRDAWLVGMGAYHGSILASCGWGEPATPMNLLPAAPRSYEALFHDTGLGAFTLALRDARGEAREALGAPRLARCVGPVYCPERESAT